MKRRTERNDTDGNSGVFHGDGREAYPASPFFLHIFFFSPLSFFFNPTLGRLFTRLNRIDKPTGRVDNVGPARYDGTDSCVQTNTRYTSLYLHMSLNKQTHLMRSISVVKKILHFFSSSAAGRLTSRRLGLDRWGVEGNVVVMVVVAVTVGITDRAAEIKRKNGDRQNKRS